MMQDIQEPKTFDSTTPLSLTSTPPLRRYELCAKLLAGFAAVVATVILLPDRPHLYFDLGIAVLLILAIIGLARFSLRQYIERPHAEMGSLMHGVAAAGAICGVLVVALTGESVGVDGIVRLCVGFTTFAVIGAAWALIAGILAYWPVHFVTTKLVSLSFRNRAAVTGAVAGLLAFAPLLATRRFHWAYLGGTLLTALCTQRAAAMHRRYTRRKNVD